MIKSCFHKERIESVKLGVIQSSICNLGSIERVLFEITHCNIKALVDADSFEDVNTFVLPGVSSFDSCMDFLKKSSLLNYLKDQNNLINKKLLGICAGAQILFESSEEGNKPGLGLLKGRVKKIKATNTLKVPHLGWNNLIVNESHPMIHLLKGINLEKKFYFSHSYRFPDSEDALAYVDYGERFPVIVANSSVIAVQFHPEKSYGQGLQIFKNFCEM